MLKKERAAYIDNRLQALYPNPPIPLDHSDSYSLLVAVLLSAQCTDARVNTVTPALFELAATPAAMAGVKVEDIKAIIRPCGLSPQKSKAISVLSKMLMDDYAGQVPDNFIDLEKLPGVGHKTASVVMSQAFGHPAFAVDTHIHRLAQRWGLTKGKNVQQTEADLKKLFAKDRWIDIHLQIIYYAREHCQARACYGLECEICRTCYPNRVNKKIVLKP
ncbi:MAG: endonuclease III [Oceanospirillaceae bacterium]|nr:endonuclease III [Oceanospirillaceae bacterium]